jgi:hypothetical protein
VLGLYGAAMKTLCVRTVSGLLDTYRLSDLATDHEAVQVARDNRGLMWWWEVDEGNGLLFW